MTNRSITGATRPAADHSQRKVAFAAAFSLLFIALLAPFAQFGAIQNLIVPADTAATTNNIVASAGLFRSWRWSTSSWDVRTSTSWTAPSPCRARSLPRIFPRRQHVSAGNSLGRQSSMPLA